MKKIIGVLAVISVLAISFVAAHGFNRQTDEQDTYHERGTFHEQVEYILEDGNYQDLVELREDTGFNMMRRVSGEEDFEEMKKRHEYMQENGFRPGYMREKGRTNMEKRNNYPCIND